MMDADALVEWVINNTSPYYRKDIDGKYGFEVDCIIDILALRKKIQELSTPVPEESIFDADGWCWDMDKAPENQNIILLVNDKPTFGLLSQTVSDEYKVPEYYEKQFFIYTRTGLMATLEFCKENEFGRPLDIKAWRPLPDLSKDIV